MKAITVPSCSVFIPLYNEEEILEANCRRLLDFLSTHFEAFEIILGSNGSTDATAEICAELAREMPQVSAFHLPQRAPGRAFVEGVRRAGSELVISQDADLSVGLDFIPLAVDFLARCDLVIGCKRMRRQRRSLVRRLGSNLFIFTASSLLGTGASDYSIGAKGFRRSFVLEHADRLDAGTAYVLELVYFAIHDERMMVELPTTCEDYRSSRFNLVNEAAHKFAHLARFSWRHCARRY